MKPRARKGSPVTGAIVVDSHGYIAGWNEGAEALLGLSATDVVGCATHHILCGRDPSGAMVCHPSCALAPDAGRFEPNGDLVLFPRTAARDVVRLTLSVFPVPGDDPSQNWLVHVITSARAIEADPPRGLGAKLARASRRLLRMDPIDATREAKAPRPTHRDGH